MGLTAHQLAIRIFLTCWVVYSLHFATNIVREIFPAVSLGDHFSFRVDDYKNMHPDLFEKEGYGWHIGNNPGASMVAAIPYALARPAIDLVVDRVQRQRDQRGAAGPPEYDSPWPMAQDFYAEAWRRGLDVKLGLAAFVMQAFLMAPSSALGVVVMFYLLRFIFRSDRTAVWLSLLYAFATPVFFRTGFLNQNLMLGHIAFLGFVAMWNPSLSERWSGDSRAVLGGVAGGTAVLFDYSGVVLLLGLFGYGIARQLQIGTYRGALRHGLLYTLATLLPIGLLWFYQWKSFGNPFLPGQHWMPPVEWIELGYQGYGWPQWELFASLAFDYRFGLFAACPLFLLALAAPLLNRNARYSLPWLELTFVLALFVALWIFFSGSNYTRLQFNTGIRYMAAIFPFLFLPAVIVLMRLPRRAVYFIAVASVTIAWSAAMHRDVQNGPGVLNPVLHVFTNGLELPALTTVSQLQVLDGLFRSGPSPIPLFILLVAILCGIWVQFGRGGPIANETLDQPKSA